MVHNSYIFININSWHTANTIASRDFLQGSFHANTFKGAH